MTGARTGQDRTCNCENKNGLKVLYLFAEVRGNLAKPGLGKETSRVAVGYLRVRVGRAHRQQFDGNGRDHKHDRSGPDQNGPDRTGTDR
jgi:hypothetical protein